MILYIENPKDSTRKLLEIIKNEFSKVTEYKGENIKTNYISIIFTLNNPKIKWKSQISYISIKDNKILSSTEKVKSFYTED